MTLVKVKNTSRDMPATVELTNAKKDFKTSIQLMPRTSSEIPDGLIVARHPPFVKVIATDKPKISTEENKETKAKIEDKSSDKK